ncbi:MAG TPA: toprim domain-containing protein, partial [Thermoanaerobaculia bacterium]|nr:toprim domain-containing protein [Thermoanaerobaculia bacterium]
GYFDVIGAVASGVEGAVAGMGTALTPEQSRLLARYAEEVVIAYDGDTAGEGAARRALPLLLVEGLAVRRARFPGGHDPDSLRLAEGEEAVRAAVDGAEDALLLEIERAAPLEAAGDPQDAAAAARAVRELLGAVSDPVARHKYIERAAERLKVPPRLILGGRERPAAEARPAGPQPARPAPVRPRDPASAVVRSLEESALDLLLRGRGVPPAGDLPPEDVFLDPPCRNIYRAFCALMGSGRGGGLPPDGRTVLAELGSDATAVDRMAQILVEAPVGSKEIALSDLFAELTRRWQEKCQKDLAGEIGEAQRSGDEAKLLALYEEKRRLSLALHRRSRPGAAGGVE